MRGVLPLVIASATLLTLPAIASEWVRVKTTANNDIFSVDTASIEGRGNIRSFWSNVEFGRPRNLSGKRAYSAIYYLSVDCRKNVYSVRFMQLLDQNSSSIYQGNYGDGAGLVKPDRGSSQEASIKFVCSR
jgi:hypothetical protein